MQSNTSFINKKCLLNAPTYQLQDIQWQILKKEQCIYAKHTTAGTDNWTPREFSLLGDEAYKSLTLILNDIEQGGALPKHIFMRKIGISVKGPDKLSDP